MAIEAGDVMEKSHLLRRRERALPGRCFPEKRHLAGSVPTIGIAWVGKS